MAVRLVIEYDGGAFFGWAKQPGLRSVQGELERALEVVLREPVALTVGGRTDRGVHALGQVASYVGPVAEAYSLNAILPDDVSVLSCDAVGEGFDARGDAVSRTYCYKVWALRSRPALLRGRVAHWGYGVDMELLGRCAELVLGSHDFRAFTLSDQPYKSYQRTIARAQWFDRGGGQLEFWIEGNSFTRRMVRTLVGFQLEVAAGRREYDDFKRLLEGADRSEAGRTAPAEGLYLAHIRYPHDPTDATVTRVVLSWQ